MPRVMITVYSARCNAASAYALISRFADYPQLTETVREVVVQPAEPDGSIISEWTVTFRSGLLRWIEQDTFDPERLTVSFRQLKGDFLTFDGVWAVRAAGAGALVTFDALFDLGIPSLAAILDPVAEATLRANVVQILSGLLGVVQTVDDGRASVLADADEAAA